MKFKTINFSDPIINYNKFKGIAYQIFKQNFVSEGSITKKFEKKIKNLINVKYALITNSGSSALVLALKTLNIKQHDEIIIPNITFQATANAVNLIGGKVVLCDINKNNLLMDPSDLKKKINKKTKAVIFVNVSGRGENILQIKKILNKKKIPLIEDASEALFSKYGNQYYGTFGDMGCFSFAPNKIITTGQGGLIVTNNKKYYKIINILKNQGKTKNSFIQSNDYDLDGFNFKSTDLNAALGLSQLPDVKRRIKKLIKIHNYYKKNITSNINFKIINFNLAKGELPLWTEVFCKNKKKIMNYLFKNNTFCRSLWKPICNTKPYKKNIKYFKNTNEIYKNIFWLPSSLKLKTNEQKKICSLINQQLTQK